MKFRLKTTLVAWPSGDQVVREALRNADIVKALYLSEDDLYSYLDLSPLIKPLYTTIIPLDSPLEDLMQQMDPKSCRYEIRKSEKMSYSHYVNKFHDEAYVLFNHFFNSNGYRETITPDEWKGYAINTDLHTIWHNDILIAAHLIMLNPSNRVRLLLSATADRKDEYLRNFISPLNRRLHWCEMIHYKEIGYIEYDFGGVVTDPNDSKYPISKFKNSFGGDLKKEYSLFIIRNKPSRIMLNFFVFLISQFRIKSNFLRSWFPASHLLGENHDSSPKSY